jgi:hypothetical protein
MKSINKDLIFKIEAANAGIKSCKWNEIFDTEEELVEAMFNEKVIVDPTSYMVCKGYEYIKSFREYYEKHGHLTDKQMTQLKRIAVPIAFRVYCFETHLKKAEKKWGLR